MVIAVLLLSSPFISHFSSPAESTSSGSGQNIPATINPVNPGAIPLGDGNLSTSPKVGSVYSCETSFSGGGAEANVPWIDENTRTWNSTAKLHVEGNVSWPGAYYSVQVSNGRRTVSTNDEPIDHTTGVFPIASTDPAYQYDKNPNHIAPQNFTLTVPATPSLASAISCVPMGPIGVLNDGVVIYNALDAVGRDAAAHEVLDSCDGHPDSSFVYHHHDIPSCILDKATGANTSTLVGYALDGFGIYVERDGNGNLLTNANLDACHGRTSLVMWDGKLTMMYHYDATLEYPYTIGCFEGTPHPLPHDGPISSTTPVTTTTTASTTTSTTSSSTTSASTSATSAKSEGANTIEVSESGLPASTRWSVTLDGSTRSGAAGSAISFAQVSSGGHTISARGAGAVLVGWSNVTGQIGLLSRAQSSPSGGPPPPQSFFLQVNGSGSLAFDFARPVEPPVSASFAIQNGKGNASIAVSAETRVSLSLSNAPAGFDGTVANATGADLGTAAPVGTAALDMKGNAHFFDVSVSATPSPGAPAQPPQGSPPSVQVCFAGTGIASSTSIAFWNSSAWVKPPGTALQGSGVCVGVPLGVLTGTVFALVSLASGSTATSTSTATTSTHSVTTSSTASPTSSSTSSSTAASAPGGVPEFSPQLAGVVLLTLAVVSGYIAVRARKPLRARSP